MSIERIIRNERTSPVHTIKNFLRRSGMIVSLLAAPYLAFNPMACGGKSAETKVPDVELRDTGYADLSPDSYNKPDMMPDSTSDVYADTSLDVSVDTAPSCDDIDGDGYGDAQGLYGINNGCQFDEPDCDDLDRHIHPYATEFCDELDNDCDGMTDEGFSKIVYRDNDRDGFGNSNDILQTCLPPGAGYVANGDDCNDADEYINPLAPEVCDGLDNDCDGEIDSEAVCGRRCTIDDVVAHWPFEETSGTTATDSSGNSYDGAIYGPVSVAGMIGNAFRYDGVDDTVTVPNSSGLDLSGELTLMAWIYQEGSPTEGRILCKRHDVWGDGYAIAASNNKFWVHLMDNDSFSSSSNLPLNEWVHAAATFNSNLGLARMYINGTLDSEHYTTQSVVSSNVDLQIGRQGNDAVSFFEGRIDEPKIYRCALWPGQIEAEYNKR
jgi:Concanavalin A-like lectin/glucanases superfamily/Putative metal-binding motif